MMTFSSCINRIHEKNQVMITEVMAISQIVSDNKNMILIDNTDAQPCNHCSIVTYGVGRTQYMRRAVGVGNPKGLSDSSRRDSSAEEKIYISDYRY
jgi:hypothetical protein